MQHKYVYIHKETGEKKYTKRKIKDPNYKLVMQVGNTKMGSDEAIKKNE